MTTGQILIALTPRERELFFAHGEAAPDRELGAVADAIDPSQISAEGWRGFLQGAAPEVLVSGWSTAPLPAAWLAGPACPLRYVCHVTGSVRRLVPRSFLEQGGLVTNWGTLAARSVAEQALLLALLALRDFGSWRACMELPPAARRCDAVRTRPLHRARVGLHGFGAVGRALVELLRPFSVSVSAYSAGVPGMLMRDSGVTPAASLEEVFRSSEVLFECEALTPATEHSVSAELLRRLPDGAVLVNVGRGRVIDETALVAEAASGRLRVAVDVMSCEPAQMDSLLCRIPGVIVSPHIGGPTVAEYPRAGEIALANVRRYLRGEPLANQVSVENYDRAT